MVAPTKEGIVGYLSSGQIKGIGPKTAEKIFSAFGAATLHVLDEEPERLLAIPGISKEKLEAIKKSLVQSRIFREATAILSPFAISSTRIAKLCNAFERKPSTSCVIIPTAFAA